MKKALISSLFPVALLVLSSAASLSATNITIGGTADAASGMTTGVVGATVDTFDDGALPTNYTATNSAAVVSGNSSWVYAAPAGDNTDYLTTGTGSVALTYTNAISYLGFYWGSVDDYNTISLTRTDGTTEAFTGSSLASLGVTANSSQSAYVNFFDESHLGWDKVVLSSTENAFEVDNIATATPEPASMAMLGAGLLALGVIARKRKRIQTSKPLVIVEYFARPVGNPNWLFAFEAMAGLRFVRDSDNGQESSLGSDRCCKHRR